MSVEQIEQSVLQKLRALPPEKQQEVLDFVEFLESRTMPKKPRRSLKGLWADLGVDISEEDIAEARREMWGNFPREDF
jgi:uncharacterized protein DUF2281